jgi:hypothetical protein
MSPGKYLAQSVEAEARVSVTVFTLLTASILELGLSGRWVDKSTRERRDGRK